MFLLASVKARLACHPCRLLVRLANKRHYVVESDSSKSTSLKPSSFGQPLHSSHPHIVQKDEVTPGFTLAEYVTRRENLMAWLPDSSMAVSIAAPVKYMSGGIFYKFRQASNFWYLTGFQEPESAIILEKTSSKNKMTLFCRGKDPAKEQWEGARTGFDAAEMAFGADDVRPIDEFPEALKTLAARYTYVYADGVPFISSRRSSSAASTSSSRLHPKSLLRYLTSPSTSRSRAEYEYEGAVDALPASRRRALAPEVGRLRMVKSEAEQRVMHEAAQVSGRVHAKTMRFAEQGMSESALAAHFEYLCALSGAQRPAYVPVVASGANALTIHYTANDQIIRDGELVLVDAGCEYNGYASDITRTFPATGTFTPPQRDLYAAVLSAQKACIALCTESARITLYELHRKSCELLRVELNQIGFGLTATNGGTETLERLLYPHFLGHPIGIDLHESSHFDRSGCLKSGMVITVEPGIYVPSTNQFPKHFHNIGIRIEDEVLVQEENPVVLSTDAPKEIVDVEGACQGSIGLEAY